MKSLLFFFKYKYEETSGSRTVEMILCKRRLKGSYKSSFFVCLAFSVTSTFLFNLRNRKAGKKTDKSRSTFVLASRLFIRIKVASNICRILVICLHFSFDPTSLRSQEFSLFGSLQRFRLHNIQDRLAARLSVST